MAVPFAKPRLLSGTGRFVTFRDILEKLVAAYVTSGGGSGRVGKRGGGARVMVVSRHVIPASANSSRIERD
jgi:hypothetical protein